MDTTKDKAFHLMGMVYDAALDEHKWPPFLEEFARAVDGNSAMLHTVDCKADKVSSIASIGYDHSRQADCRNNRSLLDYSVLSFKRIGLSDIKTGGQVVSIAGYRQTGFYKDCIIYQSAPHVIRTTLAQNDSHTLQLVAQRERRAEAFGENERQLMGFLAPHVSRAVQINHKISSVTVENEWALGALDQLRLGVILTNNQGAPLFVNRAAELMMTNGKAINICQGKLALRNLPETALLHKLIGGAAYGSQGEAIAGGDMRISLPNRAEYIHCLVTPVMPELFARLDSSAGVGCVAIFLSKPGSMQLPPKRLAALYGLSPAEAKLAAKLAAFNSMAQAASDLGIALGTARTQLVAVFEKTGAKGQAELLALLATGTLAQCRDAYKMAT